MASRLAILLANVRADLRASHATNAAKVRLLMECMLFKESDCFLLRCYIGGDCLLDRQYNLMMFCLCGLVNMLQIDHA